LKDLVACFLLGEMCSVALLPQELARPNERHGI
jgi:hypothetical protein